MIDAGSILQTKFAGGFPVVGGQLLPVAMTLSDAGWNTWDVEKLCELDPNWHPCKGFGAGVLSSKRYSQPKNTSGTCVLIGSSYHVAMVNGRQLIELDASALKRELWQRLRLHPRDSAALVFPGDSAVGVNWLVSHITAEVEERSSVGGESLTTFRQIRSEQHLLDSTSYAIKAKTIYDDLMAALKDQEPEEIEYEPVIYGGVR